MYEQVTRNKWKTVLLLFLVLVVAAGIGWLVGYLFQFGWAGAIVALGIAVVMSWSSYRYGDRIVLRASRAVPANKQQHARLINVVEGLAIGAGLPKPPAVYVIPEQAPNAFATGRDPEHSSVAVTQGLLDTMDRVELEGVIGHELSHITNRDMLVNTLVATLVGVVVLLAAFMRRAFFWGGLRGRGRDAGVVGLVLLAVGLVLSILAPIGAFLIQMAVSRRREYLADANGALLTRYPPGLASALRKIAQAPNQMRVANDATAHLWMNQPSHMPGDGVSWWERLFSTHPPIQERIKILESM